MPIPLIKRFVVLLTLFALTFASSGPSRRETHATKSFVIASSSKPHKRFWQYVNRKGALSSSSASHHRFVDELDDLLSDVVVVPAASTSTPGTQKLLTRSPSTATTPTTTAFLRARSTSPLAPKKNAEAARAEFYSKVHNVPISNEHGLELAQSWADKAISSLFAAFAHEKLKPRGKPALVEFGECVKHAVSVPLHAQCLVRLLNGGFSGESLVKKARAKTTRFERYRLRKKTELVTNANNPRRSMLPVKKKHHHFNANNDGRNWVGQFRVARDVASTTNAAEDRYAALRRVRRQTAVTKQNYYRLLSPEKGGGVSPMGTVAKLLLQTVLAKKNKTENDLTHWQHALDRLRLASQKQKDIEKTLDDPENINSLDQLAFKSLKDRGLTLGKEINEVVENPSKLKKFIGNIKNSRKNVKDPMERVLEMVRSGVQLGYRLAGQNGSEMEDKTLKMVSPRFLSVLPEDDPDRNNTINFLSPSLFSLHNEGQGLENLTSLPSLVRGFSSKDQQLWMDLIIEAAGVMEQTERIEKELNETIWLEKRRNGTLSKADVIKFQEQYEKEIRGKNGVPLYFTKENVTDGFGAHETTKVDVFEQLNIGMHKDQISEMNKTGFSLLTPDQLQLLYGPESPFNDSTLLQQFLEMNRSDVLAALEKDIETASRAKSLTIRLKEFPTNISVDANQRRSKRNVILSPVLFSPFIMVPEAVSNTFVVLSPLLFDPIILSPSVLGPVILSPGLFDPFILSPRVMSPAILSPLMFVPFILTPMVLHPFILVPGVFNPAVLSPIVLSPLILSPQVFTPFILSPLVLSPAILNPLVGSPLVLSPFVLTPVICSPQILGALVLSPYALSPIIKSPLVAFQVILSPSWLS